MFEECASVVRSLRLARFIRAWCCRGDRCELNRRATAITARFILSHIVRARLMLDGWRLAMSRLKGAHRRSLIAARQRNGQHHNIIAPRPLDCPDLVIVLAVIHLRTHRETSEASSHRPSVDRARMPCTCKDAKYGEP